MEPTAVSLPWLEVAKLALSTGIVASIVTQGLAWAIDRWKTKHDAETEATYLAARIAVTLESFAIKCANQIGDNDMFRMSDGHAGRAHGKLPEMDDFPSKANWTVLDPSLLARSLSMQNELNLSDRAIAFWFDVDPDPALVRNACDGQAGTCGYRAWKLAGDLRGRYKLPDFSSDHFSRDTVKMLKKYHDREAARGREQRE